MKKYYESPEANVTVFASNQALAYSFSYDELESLTDPNTNNPGKPTIASDKDVLIPLG